jgi:hypothetical protein
MDALLGLIIVLAVFVLFIAIVSRSVRTVVLVGICIFVVSMLAFFGGA